MDDKQFRYGRIRNVCLTHYIRQYGYFQRFRICLFIRRWLYNCKLSGWMVRFVCEYHGMTWTRYPIWSGFKNFFKKFRKTPWQIENKWYNLYLWIGFKSSRHISVVRFITPTMQGSGSFASLHSFLFLKLSHLRCESLWNWQIYSTWTLEILTFSVWKSLNFTVWESLNRPARGFWNPHAFGVKSWHCHVCGVKP